MSLSSVCVVTNALRLKRFKSDFSNYEYTSFKKNNDSDEERKTKIMKTILSKATATAILPPTRPAPS